MSQRKLLGEIEATLKKVNEGAQEFEAILEKIHSANSANQKDKYETDLKKSIKKLQRYRDKIKTWIHSNTVKDKSALIEARKLIEAHMERFKVCEREMKTKAYSKIGLTQAQAQDPEDGVRRWIASSLTQLKAQIDTFESEIEGLDAKRRKNRADNDRVLELEKWIARHRFHESSLEGLLRKLDNKEISKEDIEAIKPDVEYYIESNQEDGFIENEDMYEDLLGKKSTSSSAGTRSTSGLLSSSSTLSTGTGSEEEAGTEEDSETSASPAPSSSSTSAKSSSSSSQNSSSVQSSSSTPAPSAAAIAAVSEESNNTNKREASPPASQQPPPSQQTAYVRGGPTAAQKLMMGMGGGNPPPSKQQSTGAPLPGSSNSAAPSPGPGVLPTPTTGMVQQPPSSSSSSNADQQPQQHLMTPPTLAQLTQQRLYGRAAGGGPAPQPRGAPPSFPPQSYVPMGETSQGSNTAGGSGSGNVSQQSSPSPSSSQPPETSVDEDEKNMETFDSRNVDTFDGAVPTAPGTLAELASATLAMSAGVDPNQAGSKMQFYSSSSPGLQQQQHPPPASLVGGMDGQQAHILDMLEASKANMPEQPISSDRPKPGQYVPRNYYPTPNYFPSAPLAVFDNPNIFSKFDTDTLFFCVLLSTRNVSAVPCGQAVEEDELAIS